MSSSSTSSAAAVIANGERASDLLVAQTYLDQGIKSLAFKKYAEACENFSRAVEALTEIYGELKPQVGDALMLYGTALLKNAIASSAVLGDGGQQREETANAVAGPSTTPAAPLTAASIQFHFGGDAEEEEDEDDEQGDEEGGAEEGEPAGREDDLEMAFLMLDTARATWEKVEGVDAKKKLVEVHRLLGDVASESEQFDNAVTEYTEAIDILAPLVAAHDRALAELHMLIALAYDNVVDAVPKAVSHAEQARAILVAKIDQLEGLGEAKVEADEREIVDIKELMGDVDMKIEDLKIVPEEAPLDASELALAELIKGATGPAKAQGIINNLNSLVKRKKPSASEGDGAAAGGGGSGSKRGVDEVEAAESTVEKKTKVDA